MAEETKEKSFFSNIAEFYEKGVEEANEKGLADEYKACFEGVKAYLKEQGVTVEDEQFGDGYFIFGKGDNSVVEFKAKEFPGWSFGVWFYPDENKEGKAWGQLFWQVTDFIDKFKPSASSFCFDLSFGDGHKCIAPYELEKAIEFMKKDENYCFCIDVAYWNDQYEYHSRFDAWWTKRKIIFKEKLGKKFGEWITKKQIKLTLKKCKKLGEAFVYDSGESWTPRYEVVLLSEEAGTLRIDELKGGKSICRKVKRLERLAEKLGIYSWNNASDFVNCCNEELFYKLKALMDEED